MRNRDRYFFGSYEETTNRAAQGYTIAHGQPASLHRIGPFAHQPDPSSTAPRTPNANDPQSSMRWYSGR